MSHTPFSLRWLSLGLGLLLLMFTGCDSDHSSQQGAASGADSAAEADDAAAGRRVAPGDSTRTRGLAPADDYDLAAEFPTLANLAEGEPVLYEQLETYAAAVSQPASIQSEADYRPLVQLRDEKILSALEAQVLNEDITDMQVMQRLFDELEQLGMTLVTAEGMIYGVGKAFLLPEVAQRVASPDYLAFLQFESAFASSRSGEYPYMNMEPWQEMVVHGEQLRSMPNTPYWSQVEDEFYNAVRVVSDLHLVQSGNAREADGGTPVVGGINTEFYPYAADVQALTDFGGRYPESQLGKTIQRIAQNPSIMTDSPENLYVILLEWIEEEEAAQRKVMRYLSEGEDIPHYLPVVRGDGSTQYAISYRFFEDESQANQAYEKFQASHPDAQLIFCSVKDGKLYQLGPMMD